MLRGPPRRCRHRQRHQSRQFNPTAAVNPSSTNAALPLQTDANQEAAVFSQGRAVQTLDVAFLCSFFFTLIALYSGQRRGNHPSCILVRQVNTGRAVLNGRRSKLLKDGLVVCSRGPLQPLRPGLDRVFFCQIDVPPGARKPLLFPLKIFAEGPCRRHTLKTSCPDVADVSGPTLRKTVPTSLSASATA